MATIANRELIFTVYSEQGSGRAWEWPLFFDVAIEQTKSKRPNKGTITVNNLGDDSAQWIEGSGYLAEVTANNGLLYRGNIKTVRTAWKGTEKVTTIECGDGTAAYASAKISRGWTPGISSSTVLRDLLAVTGQASSVLGTLPEQVYENGYVASGKVSDTLADVIESMGCELSVQDGIVQILCPGAPKSGGPLLKAGAGLIGSPERKDKGGLSVKCLLRPELRPGRLFKIESRLVNGWFRCTKTNHKCTSDGMSWETDIEAREP